MKPTGLWLALLPLFLVAPLSAEPPPTAQPPPYVLARAFYILPETTSEESGYFSLCESLDGAIEVGTAKYNHNAFLVEFDPRAESQRIVLDTNATCGLTATGYAAQSKLHTRNFVGASGRVYVGSKQGYRKEGDTSEYGGGFVMTYDPRTGRCENLGMPLAGQGVIDVVADEARGRMYAVTCEDQHWMVGGGGGAPWKELGPTLTPYAATLVDSRGVAAVLTREFELAQFDPATERVISRPIMLDGQRWTRADTNSIPIWQINPDGHHAWLILMNNPTLVEIDLHSGGDQVTAVSHGRMIEGKNPDCRSAMSLHPDGKIYALIRIDNTTGFGTGYYHHLVRYDPAARRHEDLGVIKVANPEYYDWSPNPDGTPKHHSHGFQRLPDGTLTPTYAHMALLAAHDGTLYATIIYPFTLLKIDAFKLPPPPPSAGSKYLDALAGKLEEAAARLPALTQLAERLADRHLHGGLLGFASMGTTLEQELVGRSGGPMHIGFDRSWKPERTPAEKANDIIIFAWDEAPGPDDLKRIVEEKSKGLMVIGCGAKNSPLLADHVAACDLWIDNGAGWNDRVVALASGRLVGKTNHFTNALNGWLLMGEFVGALTRAGKMPPMWKSYGLADGRAWGEPYFQKVQFHQDLTVPPVPPGELGRRYLERIRYMVGRMHQFELPHLRTMAERIDAELRAGRKTIVASAGHMVMNYVGRFDDAVWADNHEIHEVVEAQLKDFEKTPDNALVLRLGEWGLHHSISEIFARKHQRLLLLTGENPRPEWSVPSDCEVRADYGAAFGDACVQLEGYPIPILPPSGVMQVAAYETIDVEVLERHGK